MSMTMTLLQHLFWATIRMDSKFLRQGQRLSERIDKKGVFCGKIRRCDTNIQY